MVLHSSYETIIRTLYEGTSCETSEEKKKKKETFTDN